MLTTKKKVGVEGGGKRKTSPYCDVTIRTRWGAAGRGGRTLSSISKPWLGDAYPSLPATVPREPRLNPM